MSIINIFSFLPQFGTNFFGASANYIHRFSSKSHARVAGRVGRYLRFSYIYLWLVWHWNFFIWNLTSCYCFELFPCSTNLDFEIGGGRRISEFSTVRMMYNIGIQVVILLLRSFWPWPICSQLVTLLLDQTCSVLLMQTALLLSSKRCYHTDSV